jgi:hypothetical protein
MGNNPKKVIIDCALTLLAKYERLQDKDQFVRFFDVKTHIHLYTEISVPEQYIQKVLDENFSQRYYNNEAVYFLS